MTFKLSHCFLKPAPMDVQIAAGGVQVRVPEDLAGVADRYPGLIETGAGLVSKIAELQTLEASGVGRVCPSSSDGFGDPNGKSFPPEAYVFGTATGGRVKAAARKHTRRGGLTVQSTLPMVIMSFTKLWAIRSLLAGATSLA